MIRYKSPCPIHLDMKLTSVFLLIAAILASCGSGDELRKIPDDGVILAFGDSLTFGKGVAKKDSYPANLSRRTGIRVINSGVSGEISRDGLKRLPSVLEKTKPDLIIICHGANDILRHLPIADMKRNVISMIKLARSAGADVILVGVPKFSAIPMSEPTYQEIAKETNTPIEDDVLKRVVFDVSLKSDRIHPNEKGYKLISDSIISLMQKYGAI